MTRKILVVDDTVNVRLMLKEFLENQNFEVLQAVNGVEALAICHDQNPDLILLDIMMPTMDGYQFLTRLREKSNLPVIMITARQQEADIIRGFELGADDYITKPFRLRELLMRVRAVMRRSQPVEGEPEMVCVQDLCLRPSVFELRKDEQLIELTPLEFHLIELLMRSAGKVLRRQAMCLNLIDHGFAGSEATLKIHIRNIRLKLGDEALQPRYIETVFGVGYRFLEGEA